MPESTITRIVHLQGGLRAVDVRSDQVFVQLHGTKRFLHFPTPAYANLYVSLKKLGFEVLGVEFVTQRPYAAPDWWYAPPEGQFKLMTASRAWGEMRHLAYQEQKADVVDISKRCTALLELLGIRILQMSNAYNGAYLAQAGNGSLPEGCLFDNTYVPHIEAAIHAFLADATNLRDLLFEFVSKYVLRDRSGSWSFKEFKRHPKLSEYPVAVELIEAGSNGWLKRLTDLRNDVVHVAPIGAHHSFPSCCTRKVCLPDGGTIHFLSYGLVDGASVKSAATDSVGIENDELIISELQEYKSQLDASDDALKYAWITLGKLIELAEAARTASGLAGIMPTIGPDDIVDFKLIGGCIDQ